MLWEEERKKCEEQNFAMEATFDYIKSNHQYLIISSQKHVEFIQRGRSAKEMMLP